MAVLSEFYFVLVVSSHLGITLVNGWGQPVPDLLVRGSSYCGSATQKVVKGYTVSGQLARTYAGTEGWGCVGLVVGSSIAGYGKHWDCSGKKKRKEKGHHPLPGYQGWACPGV